MPELSANTLGGRIPPHDLDAERALLGAMLFSSEIQDEALVKLSASDFYRTAHQTIFEAAMRLASRDENFDILSLADQLSSMGKLEAIGGRDYLIDLSTSVPTTVFWERYADIVLKLATYRRLINAGTRITALGYETPEDELATISDAEDTLFKVTNQRLSSNIVLIEDELPRAYRYAEELQARAGMLAGTPTGYPKLDMLTTGLHGGNMIILGARPSVGKTAFALNIAVESARRGTTVLVFSLEMGVAELTQRIVCAEALINTWKLRSGNLADEDWAAFTAANNKLAGMKLAIDDSPSLNIMELRTKAKRHLHGVVGKKLIVIDYLQLMSPVQKKSESRQIEISEISRGLKILAKDLDVPIIALSQLSRGIELRDDKRPILSDLRESGSLEQDADLVMFLDRKTKPADKDEEASDEQPATLYLAKHRNGPTGTIDLRYRKRYTRFIPTDDKKVE